MATSRERIVISFLLVYQLAYCAMEHLIILGSDLKSIIALIVGYREWKMNTNELKSS